MIFTDWSLDELKGFRKELARSIASGSLQVRYADRSVNYRSLDEMRRIAAWLDNEISIREGGRRVRRIIAHTEKGYA